MRKIVILVLIFLVCFMSACSNEEYTISTDISKYEEYINNVSFNSSCNFFPKVDDIPDNASVSVKYIERNAFTARSKNLVLIINLPEEEYTSYKKKLISDYVFLDNPIIDDDSWVRIPKIEFEYLNINVNVVDSDEFHYPMNFGMIGFSDANHEIFFFMYYDSDRDGITDMNQFMETEFPVIE